MSPNNDILDVMIDYLFNLRSETIPPLYPWEAELQARRVLASRFQPVSVRAMNICPAVVRPELKISPVLCAPPPNFSVPPPPIPVRFSVPPPPIHPCPTKPGNDHEGWIIDMPEDNVEVPTDLEIGFWFGVPVETKSILKGSGKNYDSEAKKMVRFSKVAKVFFRKRCGTDDENNSYNGRPKSCKIPERYSYPNYPSAEVIKALNQKSNKDCKTAVRRTKRQNHKKTEAPKPKNFYNMVAEV